MGRACLMAGTVHKIVVILVKSYCVCAAGKRGMRHVRDSVSERTREFPLKNVILRKSSDELESRLIFGCKESCMGPGGIKQKWLGCETGNAQFPVDTSRKKSTPWESSKATVEVEQQQLSLAELCVTSVACELCIC
jgi:hypothetical protein